MADKIMFSADEMKTINDLQQTYINLQNALGQTSVQRFKLEQQLLAVNSTEETIKKQFEDTQRGEKEFIDGINKKYGDGNLDITNGEFTPNPVEKPQQKTDKTL